MFFVTLLLILPFSLVQAALRNVTLGFSDSSLRFSPGWIASMDQLSGDLFFTFTSTAASFALEATLPERAQKVTYIGLKRVGGSQYGLCPNCADGNSSIILVDGHDPWLESNEQSKPTAIFSLDVDRSDQNRRHTFSLFNLHDDRFEGQSAITFQSLVVTIDDASEAPPSSDSQTSTTDTTGTMPSTTSTLPSSESSQSSQATRSASGSSSSSTSESSRPASGSSGIRSSVIVLIVVLTIVPIVSLAVGIYFCRRRARRRSSRLSEFFAYNPNPVGRRSPSYSASQPVEVPRTSTIQPNPGPGPLSAAGRPKPSSRPLDPSPYSYSPTYAIRPVAPSTES